MRPSPSAWAFALVLSALVACDRGRSDAPEQRDAGSPSASLGPDPIVLRVPRAGGPVTAYVYPRLDSAIWASSAQAPALARVLAFDREGGSLAFMDAKGLPGRVDFRLGGVTRATRASLASLASADGDAIYGVAGGKVTRLTPSGDWDYQPPVAARDVFPQPDGALVIVGERGDETVLWRVRPPEPTVLDSVVFPRLGIAGDTAGVRVPRVQAGDRLYFGVDSGLIGVRTRDLTLLQSIRTPEPVKALAATPSGDRLFVLTERGDVVRIVDRYTDRIAREIDLPGTATALRVDPVGRVVLARARRADSAWVISVADDRVLGTVRSAWREDLPLVMPDGRIALSQGEDVVLADARSLAPSATIDGGAADFWYLFRWSGFRPRAEGLDRPAEFAETDTATIDTLAADSLAPADTAGAPPVPAAGTPPAAPTVPAAPASAGFTVQFISTPREDAAREAAARIEVRGEQARVVTSNRAGTTLYRVVLGPFSTRDDAERAGRESRASYWVYEGAP